MTDTVENTQRTMIPGMGEEGEKLTAAQNPAARAGGRELLPFHVFKLRVTFCPGRAPPPNPSVRRCHLSGWFMFVHLPYSF